LPSVGQLPFVVEGDDTLKLTSKITLPNGDGPFPAVIGVGFLPIDGLEKCPEANIDLSGLGSGTRALAHYDCSASVCSGSSYCCWTRQNTTGLALKVK